MGNKYFCPRYCNIRMKPCYSKPTRKVLLNELEEIAAKNNWVLGFTEKNLSNKQCIVDILSALKRNDVIFGKGYFASYQSEERRREDGKHPQAPAGRAPNQEVRQKEEVRQARDLERRPSEVEANDEG